MMNQKQNNFSEIEMVNDCFEYIKTIKSYKSVILEVPFLSRCIDMVLITHDEKIITIEYKLNDINHALEQTRDHSLGADYSFICTPKKKRINKLFLNSKTGLLYYYPDQTIKIETILIARFNNPPRKFREMLIENISKVNS